MLAHLGGRDVIRIDVGRDAAQVQGVVEIGAQVGDAARGQDAHPHAGLAQLPHQCSGRGSDQRRALLGPALAAAERLVDVEEHDDRCSTVEQRLENHPHMPDEVPLRVEDAQKPLTHVHLGGIVLACVDRHEHDILVEVLQRRLQVEREGIRHLTRHRVPVITRSTHEPPRRRKVLAEREGFVVTTVVIPEGAGPVNRAELGLLVV
jgi:hypothetical protein